MGVHDAPTPASPPNSACLDSPLTADTLNYVMRAGPIGSWQAGDGAAPIQLDDGSTLLLMGDSIIDGHWVHNSVLHLDSHCVSALWRGQERGAAPQSIWAPHTLDTFYWPSSGYVHDGQLVTPLSEVRAEGEPGLFGFEGVDIDYAVMPLWDVLAGFPDGRHHIIDSGPWDNTPLGRLAVAHVQSDPSLVNFRVLDREGYYGSYLARLTDPSNPAAPWEWFDGETWQDDPLRVADIAPDLGFFDSRIIHPIEHDGKWWATTWAMGYSAGVATLSAPEVSGPWTVVDRGATEGVQYLHGLFELGGELVMRWSNNDAGAGDLSAMRPGFATVTS